MSNKIIFVDVDDVCALLSPVWLARYNKDYDDHLTDEDITDWNIHQFTKPECDLKIYQYLKDPGMYDEVKPREGALEGVEALREIGFRVLFATSCPVEVAGRKFYWLKEHGFIKKERDYIEIRDKSLLLGRFMIDDSYDNVNGFTGYGYLLTRPWNEKYKWYHRIASWEEFIIIMKENYNRGI
jgi:5'-nucleotidase